MSPNGDGHATLDDLPLTLLDVVDRACDRYESERRAGRSPLIEAFLAEAPAPARPALLAQLLLLEIDLARRAGTEPGSAEYRARFPDLAGVVDGAFRADSRLLATQRIEEGEWGFPSPPVHNPVVRPEIPGYEILDELGRGGMGVVYRARELRLNRIVALKTILAGRHATAELSARFRAEAEIVARLRHANVVRIHSVSEHDGLPIYEMEYVAGGSLASRLDGTPWPPREAARLIEAVARGAGEIHRLGVVHRDLKPGNILIDADGTPKIGDFGLAKNLAEDEGLTRTDSVIGSPSYMAPEQAEGRARKAEPTSDVYSLGAILYELLVGRPPFRGTTVLETLRLVRTAEPVPPSRLVPGVSRDIETIALKCLEKTPARRYESAGALADDLGRFLELRPIHARRVGPAGRAWRWARRNTGTAVLGGLVVLLLLTLTAVGTAAALRVAAAAAKERRTLYFARMNLVQQAWEAADVRRMAELLAPYAVPAAGEDHRGFEWWYWSRLAKRSSGELDGHSAGLAALAASPDGRSLAALDLDRNLRIWDLETKSARSLGPRTEAEPIVAAFSPDGATLAVGSKDGSILLVDARSEAPVVRRTLRDGREPATALVFLDARTLISAHDPNIDRVWDLESGALRRTTRGTRPPPGKIPDWHVAPHALSRNGAMLAAAGRDGLVILRDTSAANPGKLALESFANAVRRSIRPGATPADASPASERTLRFGEATVRSLAFSPDGSLLAVGSEDLSVTLWDVAAGRIKHVLRGHTAAVFALAFPPDGATVVSAGLDNTASLWDVATGRLETTLKGHGGPVTALASSPDGASLATGGLDRKIRLWRVAGAGSDADRPLSGHTAGVEVVAFSPGGRTLASGGRDGRIVVWDADSGVERRRIEPGGGNGGGYIRALAFSPDGAAFFSAGLNSPVRRWTPDGSGPTGSMRHPHEAPYHGGRALAVAPDGRLAAGGDDGCLTFWNPADGTPLAFRKRSAAPFARLAFSPDGSVLAGTSGGAAIEILDPESGAETGRLTADERRFTALAIAPDGRTLASGGEDGVLILWDLATRTPRGLQWAHTNQITSIAFSPDGRTIASGGRDNTIRLWDAAEGELKTTLKGHTGNVMSVAFSPDGRTLASGSLDGTVRLWRAAPK